MDTKTYSDIVTQVGQFYANSWLMLMGGGALILAIVGVLIPYITHQYQKRIFKIEEDRVMGNVADKITTLKKELKTEVLEELKVELVRMMEEKSIILSDKLTNTENSLRGSSSQLQGNVRMTQGINKGGTIDFISSVEYYLDSDKYTNIQPILESILKTCLPLLTHGEIISLKSEFDAMFVKIAEKDKYNSFLNLCEEIKNKIVELSKA
jgi:dihydroorotase